jgi:transposase
LESYVIKEDCVQFCFEIDTGPKKDEGVVIGVDTGINTLATCSDGRQYGRDIKAIIEKIKRKQRPAKNEASVATEDG